MNVPRINSTLGLTKGNMRNRITNIKANSTYIGYEQDDRRPNNEVFVIYGGLAFTAFTYDTALRTYKAN
ncbi:hypothetical protein [Caldivirga sp. UBA161]|uniref:hypothetical protein n=1 Tax=Caldivirga sp. UBA161 TaxID=1915569 RepID=UPI0025C1EAF4|nr:hypothetical protein [Caldivirga sp. UBA161]